MQFISTFIAVSAIACSANAVAIETVEPSVFDLRAKRDSTGFSSPSTFDEVYDCGQNLCIITFGGKHCNGANQGSTMIGTGESGCAEMSNAKSFRGKDDQGNAYEPVCISYNITFYHEFECKGKGYGHRKLFVDECHDIDGAVHPHPKSARAKCVHESKTPPP